MNIHDFCLGALAMVCILLFYGEIGAYVALWWAITVVVSWPLLVLINNKLYKRWF